MVKNKSKKAIANPLRLTFKIPDKEAMLITLLEREIKRLHWSKSEYILHALRCQLMGTGWYRMVGPQHPTRAKKKSKT